MATSLVKRGKNRASKSASETDLKSLAPVVPPPSADEILAFDIKNGYIDTPEAKSVWRLQPGEHAFSRVLRRGLAAYEWQTDLFRYPELLHKGVLKRLENYLVSLPRSIGSHLARPPVRALLSQQALFLDAWSEKYALVADLYDYKALGLVDTLPGMQYHPNSDARRSLMRVYTTACLMDRYIAASAFFVNRDSGYAELATMSGKYETDLSKLHPIHPIYTAADPFPAEKSLGYAWILSTSEIHSTPSERFK